MGRARRAPSRIVSIPSSDATFAQVVESILQRGTIGTEHDLETALHPLYPLATVRGRELSGERFATWYVYGDDGEPMIPEVVKLCGDDRIVYASDYYHWDCAFPDTVKLIAERGDLSDGTKRKILGDNAKKLFRL